MLTVVRLRMMKALAWLEPNQERETGQWWSTSLNKQRDPVSDAGRFMSDAATADSVLALPATCNSQKHEQHHT